MRMMTRLCLVRQTMAVLLACAALFLFAPAALAKTCGLNEITDTVQKTNWKGAVIGTITVCIKCKSGQVANADHTKCVAAPPPPPPPPDVGLCPKGDVVAFATDGMYECMKCPAGTVSDNPDGPGTTCLKLNCGPGHASNPEGASCVACGPGTYSKGAGPTCLTCPSNSYSGAGAAACSSCPKGATVNATHTACTCPAGTRLQYGYCVSTRASTTPIVIPNSTKKTSSRPVPGPGLLDSTPGLGSQGPAAVGTPIGGAPSGGSRGPAGIR
jgi:hypothetical protein